MNKTQLINWIKEKETEALRELGKQYLEKKAAHDKRLYEEIGLYELANEVQGELNKVYDKVKKWKEELTKEGVTEKSYYNSLTASLYNYVKGADATLKQLTQCDFEDNTRELNKLRDWRDEVTRGIRRNYANVTNNLRSLKTAKLGIQYLEELSFDLTELIEADKKPITSLVEQVDKEFLFINGRGE